MNRHLFALAWADARVTGDAEEKAVSFRLEAKAIDCIDPRKGLIRCVRVCAPSRGQEGEGKRKVFRKGLLSGGEYFFWCA